MFVIIGEEEVEVQENVFQKFIALANLVSDVPNADPIPLADIDMETWKAVVACVESDKSAEIIASVDVQLLAKMILAAEFLNCESLMRPLCAQMARRTKGKTTEQLRELFTKTVEK
jgi:hypothetical protein